MKVQSLSVVVPGGCPNKCRFCVSELHPSQYPNHIEKNRRFRDLYKKDFMNRLQFARNNGCNTVMLTGDGEPLINEDFLNFFSEWNSQIPDPFLWIEVQTSGVTLDEPKLRWLRNEVRVGMISLSLSDMFSSDKNQDYNRTPEKLKIDIDGVCKEIKLYDFGLRLSLNMTDVYNDKTPTEIFQRAKNLGADQVTFRVLYTSPEEDHLGVNQWIREHRANDSVIQGVKAYIRENGRKLERLPFGAWRYSVMGMSVVVDDDCMSTAVKEDGEADNPDIVKYLVLQPNCKLYTKWDDKGSLLF